MLTSPRAAILLVFAAFGAVVGGHLGAIPVIMQNTGMTDLFFGQAQSITMLMALVAMLFGGYLGRYFDHRSILIALLPLNAAALIFALLVQSPGAYLLSIILIASLLSMADIHMNAEGAIIEEELKRPIYAMYHASVSAAMAVTAILSSILSVTIGPLASGVVGVVMCLWAMWEVARLVKRRPPQAHEGPKNFAALPMGKLITAGSAVGLAGVCELLAVIYAGQLLVQLEPALAAYSGLGVAFFGACMALVRFFGDRLRQSFGDKLCCAASLSLASAGFLTLSFSPNFALSVIAFAGVGLGMAFVSPVLFPLIGRLVPAQRSTAMGIAFAVSNGYRFVTPAIVGLLVTWYGLSIVFAVCFVFCLGALLLAHMSLNIGQTEKGAVAAAP